MRNRIKKILLVRPPRHTRYSWSYYTDASNFILPLGLLCVAAAIKRDLPHLELKIIDCLPLKIGWVALKNIIEKEKPDLVGVGEGVVYQHEGARVCKLAKEVDPGIITIAGGHFFSWMVDYSLDNYPIDFIVRFEGEETAVDLLRALDSQGDLSRVKGIAYKNSGKIVKTLLRPLIKDLDALAMPAFDLVPVDKYLFWKYTFGRAVNLEHSRGCVDKCNFCCMWTFWGGQSEADIENGQLDVLPKYRTKSVQRTLEEIDLIYNKYKRNFIFWTDATFSVDPEWTDEFSEKLIKRNYKDLHWCAYLRTDFTVRDEKLGILEKMVRSGLSYCYMGVERESAEELKNLKKTGHLPEISREAFTIFKEKYPQVIRQATYLLGLPDDTRGSLMALEKFASSLHTDYDIFYPFFSLPGTYIYKEVRANNLTDEVRFRDFKFTNNLIVSKTGLSQKELSRFGYKVRILNAIHRLDRFRVLFSPYRLKRRFFHMYMIILARKCLLFISNLREG